MGHLFSWVWVLAGLSSLYFLAIAVLSDGKWSHFFLAVVVSFIAKGAARSFLYDEKKKLFVDQLISEGYTPDEALAEYQQQLTSGEWSLARVERIINDYGRVLEHKVPGPNGMVADESQLPHPKNVIQMAILYMLERGTLDEEQRGALMTGFISLADFQPGVDSGDTGVDVGSERFLSLPVDEQINSIADNGVGGEWLEKSQTERDALVQQLKREGHWLG